jgi:hydroxymethylglutaryl-CoA lyase
MGKIKITESPRDAIQGLTNFIAKRDKIAYLNNVIAAGFDVVDVGSFVSPRAVPQLRDTGKVIEKLKIPDNRTKLMVLVANMKGAVAAGRFDHISYLSFPFSVSETFLKRNINSTFGKARVMIDLCLDIAARTGKEVVIYLSMAFGNPYGDKWDPDMVLNWTTRLMEAGVEHISVADTIGVATPESIALIISNLRKEFPSIDLSLHLHTTHETWYKKIDAAYKSGCHHFEGVLNGLGGCPMTGYEMVGNLNTELLLDYCTKNNLTFSPDPDKFNALKAKARVFYELGNEPPMPFTFKPGSV